MRRVLPALMLLAAAWAVIVAFTGGFDVDAVGLRLKSTSPDRPVYALAILTALYIYLSADDARRRAQALAGLAPAIGRVERAAVPIVVALSLAVFIAGVRHGVLVAEASDAWGYVSQADLWLAGDLIVEQPVANQMPWPNAGWTLAPLGYRPAIQAGAIVPTYPAGLPVLMAAVKSVIGGCGPFIVAPALGGFTIWFTYLLGVRLSSRLVALAAAALMATSPIFLLMALSPLSDVPTTAFLLLSVVLALSSLRWRALLTGAAVSMAIFIRPNLLFVGAVFMTYIVICAQAAGGESLRRARWREFLRFAAGGAPLVTVVAALNTVLYGAPWAAGHGSLEELYSWQFMWLNLIDYPRWIWATETPFIVLAVVPLIAAWRAGQQRASMSLLLAFVATVVLSYLFYRAYGLWLYLRFLLPIIPILLVLASWGMATLLDRLAGTGERIAVALLVMVAVLSLRIGTLRADDVLGHWREGVPYTSVGEYVRQNLPANAVLLTVQHSGSIRYYADRLTVRWDFLPPGWWPRALDALSARGYRPYVVLSDFEEDAFRSRFGLSNASDAPGTIVAAFSDTDIRVYDPLRPAPAPPAAIPAVRADPCGCL